MGLFVLSTGVTGHYAASIQQACQVACAQHMSLMVLSPAFHDCTLPAMPKSSRCPISVYVNTQTSSYMQWAHIHLPPSLL